MMRNKSVNFNRWTSQLNKQSAPKNSKTLKLKQNKVKLNQTPLISSLTSTKDPQIPAKIKAVITQFNLEESKEMEMAVTQALSQKLPLSEALLNVLALDNQKSLANIFLSFLLPQASLKDQQGLKQFFYHPQTNSTSLLDFLAELFLMEKLDSNPNEQLRQRSSSEIWQKYFKQASPKLQKMFLQKMTALLINNYHDTTNLFLEIPLYFTEYTTAYLEVKKAYQQKKESKKELLIITIKMETAQIGPLKAVFYFNKNTVSLQFFVQQKEIRDLLRPQLQQLRDNLNKVGINVDNLGVSSLKYLPQQRPASNTFVDYKI